MKEVHFTYSDTEIIISQLVCSYRNSSNAGQDNIGMQAFLM